MTARSTSRTLHVVVLLAGFIAGGTGSVVSGQDNNWDLRNYHYYNPHAFLNDKIGVDFAPAQRQSYLNPLSDVPLYWGINHLPPRVYAFLLGGVQGLTLGLLFAIAFLLLRNRPRRERVVLSLACAGLGFYAPVFIHELGMTANDTLLGMFVLGAVYGFLRVIADGRTPADPRSRRMLILGALTVGFATGLKMTLMVYAIGLAVALLAVERTWKDRGVLLAVWSGMFLAGFLVSNGYWMAKIWQQFGNPFFPFYNDVFKSEWAAVYSYADRSWLPKTVWSALARPVVYAFHNQLTVRENLIRDARYAVLYALYVGSLLAWVYRRIRKRQLSVAQSKVATNDARFLLVFIAVSFVVWEVQFGIIRYASCIEALAPLAIVILLYKRLARRWARTAAVAIAFAGIALLVRQPHPPQPARIDFAAEFWQVTLPTLPDPGNSLIIVANGRPWGYLAALFPNEVRWVTLNSNLTKPQQKTRMQTEIRDLIQTHNGDMYMLSRAEPSPQFRHDIAVLAYYRLAVVAKSGMPVRSRHSGAGLHLWRVVRF